MSTQPVAQSHDSETDEVRHIEAGAVADRYARGWHCLGLARDFLDGKPHTIFAFGQKLVVFAGADGEISVLDAYCRHMGGDLSQGEVKGNNIACPFHDWRWGGDGKCKSVPYARRVPLRARTAAWPTHQSDGMLFLWNDPEGNEPGEGVVVPKIDGLDEGEWSDWEWNSLVVDTNCREIIDNMVDMAHFFYIHRGFPTYFKNIFEGHIATQFFDGKVRDDIDHQVNQANKATAPKMIGNTSVASYYGPAFMIDYLGHEFEGFSNSTILINCHYPIDQNSFVLMYGIKVQKIAGMDDATAAQYAKGTAKGVEVGFLQDVEIWKNKTRIDNPLLCEEDGPVYQLRRWYEQFYVDVADVTSEMTDRFEFEIDTSKAVEAWEREVADNIARRDQEAANA